MSFYGAVRALFRPIGRSYFGLSVDGLNHMPRSGGAIVAANHASWLDPAVVGAACPRPIRFLIARSVYEKGAMRWFYRGMRAIPVESSRSNASWLRAALRALGNGEMVGIFPEGAGLDRNGAAREAQPGAMLLGALSGAPFVPTGVVGTYAAWPPGRTMPRPARVTVRFGEPFAPWPSERRPDREAQRLALEDLMRRIRALGNGDRSCTPN